MTNFIGKSLENGKIEQKISLYAKALELDSEDVNAMKALAFCYKDLGKFDLAIKYFSCAKRKTPFDRTVYYELGQLEFLRKNFIKAIKLFMTAIKLSPDYIEAIMAMADAHVEISEFDMAEMIYFKVLEKQPQNVEIYNKLGYLYIKTRDYKKALNCFRDILALDENNVEAYFGMARTFDEGGKEIEARRYYKKYINSVSLSPNKSFAVARLSQMKAPKTFTHANRAHLRVL